MWRFGVDIGGTFTDIVLFDEETGSLKVLKISTTPRRPSEGVLKGFEELKLSLEEISTIVHATTLGTNMFLGQEGLELPKVALLTTEGFRDVIEIGRQRRAELYNLFFEKPKPLILRRDRFEISERIGPRGEVIKELKLEEAKELAHRLCKEKYEVVAVSLLHSYLNPKHEVELKNVIKEECPSIEVVLSHEVDPEHKEYERTSTTVVNAFLKPLLSQYLNALIRELESRGFRGEFYVMQSSGGVSRVEYAVDRPAAFIESGPAAGAVAVAYYSKISGDEKVIGFDMGGTTAKASTILKGIPAVTLEYEVGGKVHAGRIVKGSGYPVRFPFIDLAEVSAGGGTIAWIDEGGALRVGPISAGAEPGPACYGRGGREPTITDANLVLGRLGNELAGGRLILDKSLAERAILKIAKRLKEEIEETAYGILKLANTIMAKAIRIVTVERGYDPRDFKIYAFGGAGPLHGVEVGEELGVKRVLIPIHPGVFSAIGLLLTDYRVDKVASILKLESDVEDSQIENVFEKLVISGEREISRSVKEKVVLFSLDIRYLGQAYELNIPWRGSVKLTVEEFHRRHEEIYGFSSKGEDVEIVNARVTLIGSMPKPLLPSSKPTPYTPSPEKTRRVYFADEGWVETPIYLREKLKPGATLKGPAVIEEYDSTILIPPGYVGSIDEHFNIQIEKV